MEKTLGAKIAEKRKEKKMTQEELAERLGVSSQAVSKWENDISCPDIMMLPRIAALFDTTVDELLGGEKKPDVVLLPKEERKKIEDMMLRVIVKNADGEKVRINLPLGLIKILLESGLSAESVGVKGNSAFKKINFEQIFRMVESGMIGKLMEIESGDGETVEIVVE